MGYEVDVEGKITFQDVEGFKKAFEKIAQKKQSEGAMHGDYDYFFTKMWGDNLEKLDKDDGIEFDFFREGKLWYDDEKAMKLLSRFATGKVEFFGEDDCDWKFKLNGDGTVEKEVREQW